MSASLPDLISTPEKLPIGVSGSVRAGILDIPPDCRLVNACQPEATSRRLAIYHREGKGQVEATLPQNLVWTGH